MLPLTDRMARVALDFLSSSLITLVPDLQKPNSVSLNAKTNATQVAKIAAASDEHAYLIHSDFYSILKM